MAIKDSLVWGELGSVIFAKVDPETKEYNEALDTWRNSLQFVVEREKEDLYKQLLTNGFDVSKVSFVKFKNILQDKLFYLWYNVFKLGEKHINDLTPSSIDNRRAEFSKEDDLREIDEQLKRIEQKLPTIQPGLREAMLENKVRLERAKAKLEKKIKLGLDGNVGVEKGANRTRGVTRTPRVTTDQREQLRAKVVEGVEENRILGRRKKETTKTEEQGYDFLTETDFGRVYLTDRIKYISNVYGKGEVENLTDLVTKLKSKVDAPGESALTNYFERTVKQNASDKVLVRGSEMLEADGQPRQTLKINGKDVEISPGRKVDGKTKPKPVLNRNTEKELLADIKALINDDKRNVSRIAETELSAAYNLGRIHAMYRNGTKLVRWINDRENTLSGKVCLVCLSIAQGKTNKPQVTVPPELSGIYTLDEILTERQLALPSHCFCSCFVRPLNKEEQDLFGAVPDGLGETITSAIATVGTLGANTINVQENERRADAWWGGSFVKNALLVGAGVVTMGAAMYWMRKSLGAKGAAELLKKRGVDIAEKIDKRRIGLKAKDVIRRIDQPQLDESLKIKDDLNLLEPELKALPDLGKIMRNLESVDRGKVEELLEMETVSRSVAELGKVQLQKLDDIPTDELPFVQGQLQRELFYNESLLNQLEHDSFGADGKLAEALDKLKQQAEDTFKVTRKSYEKVEKALVERGQPDVKPKRLGSFETDAQTYGEMVDGRLKKIESMVERAEKVLDGWETRGINKVEYNRYKDESNRTRRLLKELTEIEKEMGENDIKLFEGYVKAMDSNEEWLSDLPQIKGALDGAKEKVARLDKAREVMGRMQKKLGDLESNVQTYVEKVRDNKVKDRFIKPDDVANQVLREGDGKASSINRVLKLEGIKRREKGIKQLTKWLPLSDVKTVFEGGLRDDVRKVLGDLGEDVEAFMALDNARMKKRMRDLIKELDGEVRRLKYAEFRKYQEKWLAQFTLKTGE